MHKSLKACLLLLTVLTVYLAVMGGRVPTLDAQSGSEQRRVDESQFPTAEAEAPEPPTPVERTKKNNKEKKYKKYRDTIGPGVTVASFPHHWPPGFPTLPVAQSDVVLIGEVSDAKAYVSGDKSTVYSEFSIQVVKVLKNDHQTPLSPGGTVVAERPGGRVKYPSGHVSRFSITGWGMPLVKRQYILFLTRNDQDGDYRIVTGYELRNGRIFPLDMTTSSETDFDAYINMDAASFSNQLRAAIAASSPTPTQ
jgi:hypothetical protein